MDIQKLKIELKKRKIPKDAYTLLTSPRDESLVLERKGDIWSVFYSERGLRTEENFFSSEAEACNHFLIKILSWFNKKG